MSILKKLIPNFNEASTWRGIAAILTSVGIIKDPAQATAIIAAGMAVMGAIGAFFPDKVSK